MTRSAVSSRLVAVFLLLPMTGCVCFDRMYLPQAHSDSWDPVLGSCHSCGVCGGDCEGHTPASFLKHTLTCSSGCGEIYWGEWLSDPPQTCDPCDDCGNFIGPVAPAASHWHRMTARWEGRPLHDHAVSGTCDSCAAGVYPTHGVAVPESVFADPPNSGVQTGASHAPPHKLLRSVRFAHDSPAR